MASMLNPSRSHDSQFYRRFNKEDPTHSTSLKQVEQREQCQVASEDEMISQCSASLFTNGWLLSIMNQRCNSHGISQLTFTLKKYSFNSESK